MRKLEIRAATPPQHGLVVGGVLSAEGEYLAFPTPIPVAGSVDNWMARVDLAMRTTVQLRLLQVLLERPWPL